MRRRFCRLSRMLLLDEECRESEQAFRVLGERLHVCEDHVAGDLGGRGDGSLGHLAARRTWISCRLMASITLSPFRVPWRRAPRPGRA